MFDRHAVGWLAEWKNRIGRKPLVMRGARQVGKSAAVRLFAQRHFDNLVEVNFEYDPEARSLFASPDPARSIQALELRYNAPITPGRTLLFLDEVQAWPEVLARLRYFHEKLPELHVVAAGSLLDFALHSPPFSVPVGRLEFLHLGPVQFEEFLNAVGQPRLARFLDEWVPGMEMAQAIHDQLMHFFRSFVVVGGMPEAVAIYAASGSLLQPDRVKHSILATFRDDFARYASRTQVERLRKLFAAIPRMVGRRFKYSHVDSGERSADLAGGLDMLQMARVAWRVRHSSANGVPLGAQTDNRRFKVLFLDVGLMLSSAGLGASDVLTSPEWSMAHSGAVAEQVVGQHLLYSDAPYRDPEVYFWGREARNSSAEVDYVLAEEGTVVPVEVKAGSAGTLRSLQLFLAEKKLDFGLRLCSSPPILVESRSGGPANPSPFRLLSLPLYMVSQVRRVVRCVTER